MPAEDVAHRAAVGNHIPLKLPCATQGMLEKKLAGTGRFPVAAIVSAHDGSSMTLHHGSAECGKVSVLLVVFAYIDVHEMASGLGSAVYGEMLRGRNGQI